MPIRARIAFFGAAVVAVTVVVFGVVVYLLVDGSLRRELDAELETRGIQYVRTATRIPSDRAQLPVVDLATGSEPFVELVDPRDGTPLFSTGELNGSAPVIPLSIFRSVGRRGLVTSVRAPQGTELRIFVGRNPFFFVVYGQPTRVVEARLERLRIFLMAGVLFSLLVALAASWWLAGRAVKPLETMAQTAEQIGRTQDLARRLPELRSHDEVSRLTRSFNDMLQRLQAAYHHLQVALAAQRRFVADASHELRTPLTTIRSNVGLMLQRTDIQPEDRQAALQDIASESERMSRLVQDLLTLARADAGQHLDREPLDLRTVVQDVTRQAQTVHPQRRVELEDGTAVRVSGNADALKQLLWILINNAAAFTQTGGQIRVGLTPRDHLAELSVADDGAGIPPADLDRIFDRFYQADSARSGSGAGLGLAIAQWIVQEHAGEIAAVNNPDRGATFTVTLPLTSS